MSVAFSLSIFLSFVRRTIFLIKIRWRKNYTVNLDVFAFSLSLSVGCFFSTYILNNINIINAKRKKKNKQKNWDLLHTIQMPSGKYIKKMMINCFRFIVSISLAIQCEIVLIVVADDDGGRTDAKFTMKMRISRFFGRVVFRWLQKLDLIVMVLWRFGCDAQRWSNGCGSDGTVQMHA